MLDKFILDVYNTNISKLYNDLSQWRLSWELYRIPGEVFLFIYQFLT